MNQYNKEIMKAIRKYGSRITVYSSVSDYYDPITDELSQTTKRTEVSALINLADSSEDESLERSSYSVCIACNSLAGVLDTNDILLIEGEEYPIKDIHTIQIGGSPYYYEVSI